MLPLLLVVIGLVVLTHLPLFLLLLVGVARGSPGRAGTGPRAPRHWQAHGRHDCGSDERQRLRRARQLLVAPAYGVPSSSAG